MSRVTLFNLAWLSVILLGVLAVAWQQPSEAAQLPVEASAAASGLELVRTSAGAEALRDSGGHAVPLRAYRRIASGGSVADDLLLALCEPERIAALTAFGHANHLRPHLYGERPLTSGASDPERLKALGVDLLVVHHLGAPSELARLRELGIEVFNLGEMRGLSTLEPNIRAVALLLGDAARGERLITSLRERLEAVARDIPQAERKHALYISAYGGQLFGGGANTSYHDLLTFAGLVDVAAPHFVDFPQLDPEQILKLDPEIVVTHSESRDLVCRTSALSALRACQDAEKGVIGLPGSMAGDPGPGMLDAAELLRSKVYGSAALAR